MNIIEATASYEKWLSGHMPLNAADIAIKHERMAASSFEFLRATFYRWMQRWDETCSEIKGRHPVLAVGDLHIENFGTWRDLDGRLIWGVNDFDEVFTLSYAIDLVRLGVSAGLAVEEKQFSIDLDDAIESMLDGYQEALEQGGRPFVLEEHHRWLRKIAMNELRDPEIFWKKTKSWLPPKGKWAPSAKKILVSALPKSPGRPQFFRRVAGLGSLGRPRFTAVIDCHGGKICREAKAMAPSACLWARNHHQRSQHTEELLKKAKRVPDPIYYVKDKWLVRRLAPHCSRIEMSHWPKKRDEMELMWAMGFETANIHWGSLEKKDVGKILTKKWRRKIIDAIEDMTDVTLEDWRAWRRFSLK